MSTLSRGLSSQFEVIWAVMLRETRTRFGAHSFGYLWALLEPLLMIFTFWVLMTIAHRPAPPGMDIFTFLCTGIVPYNLFTNTANKVADSINGNRPLLYYPLVQPLDLVFARTILEIATYGAVFIILMGGHALYHHHLEVDDALVASMGLLVAGLLGASLGMVLCMLGQYSKFVDRARGFIFRPLFWLSGVFYTVAHLPEKARDAVLVNPVLHCVELVRAGWFKSYHDTYVTVTYPLLFILVLGFIGLSLERAVRTRIELT